MTSTEATSTETADGSVICNEQWIPSKDDTTLLHVYKWTSKGGTDSKDSKQPTAEILIVHGYLEHAKRYHDMAVRLCKEHGVQVTAFDVRGHGKSKTYRNRLVSSISADDKTSKKKKEKEYPRGYVASWGDYFEDIETVAATLTPDIPHYLFGHSNGGLIVLAYWIQVTGKGVIDSKAALQSTKLPFDGILLTSAFVQPAESIPAYKKMLANFIGASSSYLTSVLTVPANLKTEHVTGCPVKQKEHREDELLFGDASFAWAYHVQNVQKKVLDILMKGDQHDTKLWFAYSSIDKIACPTTNQDIAAALKKSAKDDSLVTVVVRPNEEHEIWNDVGRQEVFDMVGNWVKEQSK